MRFGSRDSSGFQVKGNCVGFVARSYIAPRVQFEERGAMLQGQVGVTKRLLQVHAILQEFHDSAWGGHSRIFRTYKRISDLFYWEGMKNAVQQYVRGCEVCQRCKYEPLVLWVYYTYSPFQ